MRSPGFSRILSDSSGFFYVLLDSLGFFKILWHCLLSSRDLAGLSYIHWYNSWILSYSSKFLWILLYIRRFLRILLNSIRYSRNLSNSLNFFFGFSSYSFEISGNSDFFRLLSNCLIHTNSFGFSPILSKFGRFVSYPPDSLVFSHHKFLRILSFSFGFFAYYLSLKLSPIVFRFSLGYF